MNPIAISSLAFVLIVCGEICGFLLRPLIPERHVTGVSQDVIKSAIGLIATMTALVLGLLIASANSTYEAKRTQIDQITAQIILLDHLLDAYGAEARDIRESMRQAIGPFVARIWSEESPGSAAKVGPYVSNIDSEAIYRKVHLLSPKNDLQRSLRDEALAALTSLSEPRLQLFAQPDSAIPRPFVAVVISWLVVIFLSYGLLAPPNTTMLAVLFICAVSASAALFLILEMSEPFTGLMAIPTEPLSNALAPLDLR